MKDILDFIRWIVETFGWWVCVSVILVTVLGLVLWDVREKGLELLRDFKKEKANLIKKYEECEDEKEFCMEQLQIKLEEDTKISEEIQELKIIIGYYLKGDRSGI